MGVRIDALTEADAAKGIVDAAVAGSGHWAITANLDHLRRYQREPGARQLIEEADVVIADGTPLIWASRLAGAPLPERVAGSNIIWSISELARDNEASIFLLGGDPGIADRAAQALIDHYPGLKVVGTLCPPVGFEKDERELNRIQHAVEQKKPLVVFVGLGFPKQDFLIKHLRATLPQASFIGVGISLSFVAGEVSRAPRWTHEIGLEWLYRLLQEPRRLVRRYIFQGMPFALTLLSSATWYRVRGSRAGTSWGWDVNH